MTIAKLRAVTGEETPEGNGQSIQPRNMPGHGQLRRAGKNGRGFFREIYPFLRCPDCSGHLSETNHSLSCQMCHRSYPIKNDVAQFVPSEDYASNFGFEWSKYSRTQLDRDGWTWSENAFRSKTGFSPEQLRGKRVLDVGCGMGRFAEVASRWGANVVGIDLSRAAEVAAHNLGDRDNVWFCRTDLRRLPFAHETFDFIYSIGVLHHTPDCKQAFQGLIPFLKPGGTIAIWVYSGYDKWYRMSDFYRQFTTRLSAPTLHRICSVVDHLYYLHKGLRAIPVLGRRLSGVLNFAVPIPLYPNRDLRVLDSFDWYSPKYQSKHTYEEVFRWLEECDLSDLRVLLQPVAVSGRKSEALPRNSDRVY